MKKSEKPGKKGKSKKDTKPVRSALAAYKLVAYMNLTHTFDGRRLVSVSMEDDHERGYADGLDGWEPRFSSSRVKDENRSLFMTFDWLRLGHKHELLDRFKDPAPWKDIQPFALIYFFDAAIRTLDLSRRVYRLDLRLGEEVIAALKTKENAVSFLLKTIGNNIKRTLNVAPELYLVIETEGKGGLKIHAHGAVLIDADIDKDALRKPLRLALGSYRKSHQIWIRSPHPKRAAYLSKQALVTSEKMLGCGFKSGTFLAATNNVRSRAKELWENEVRLKKDDFMIDPFGEVKHTKIRSRLLDLYVDADRTALKKSD